MTELLVVEIRKRKKNPWRKLTIIVVVVVVVVVTVVLVVVAVVVDVVCLFVLGLKLC